MILINFSTTLEPNDSLLLKKVIAALTTMGFLVRLSADDSSIVSQMSNIFADIWLNDDLFSLEYTNKRFIKHVINIGNDPSHFLDLLQNKNLISKLLKIIKHRDVWVSSDRRNDFESFDCNFITSNGTFRTFVQAKKINIQIDNQLSNAALPKSKIGMMFMFYKHNMAIRNMEILAS